MSTHGDNTWWTIDDLLLDGGGGANSIAVGRTGRLNVVGEIYDTSNVSHLMLRRSSDGGTWVNVDDFLYGAVNATIGKSILALPDGSTLAGGNAFMSSDLLVRRLPPRPPK